MARTTDPARRDRAARVVVRPHEVDVAHPWEAEPIGTLRIVAGAVATSGIGSRLWDASAGGHAAWARRLAPRLVTLHEQLSITGLLAIAVHGVTLLGDPYLRPGLAGIALPGAMAYRPLFTALGVIGGWLTALLGLSYYARRRIGVARWRAVHRFTLAAGTDAGSAWLRWPVLASIPLVLVLLALRVARRVPPTSKGAPIDDRSTQTPAPRRRPLPTAPRGS